MKYMILLTTVLLSGVLVAADAPKGNAAAGAKGADAKGAKGAATGDAREKVEARAKRVVKNAVALFAQKEDERAVGLLEAVGRMYPDSETRFVANLELGRHFLDKRQFDRALAELRSAQRSPKAEVQAESLLLQGQLQNARAQPAEAMMVLRRLTQDYPTSPFANEAYFLIGQIHFEAHRWSRASDAFKMVGTAVPETPSNEVVKVEAGQRVFVHVTDKDLAVLQSLGDKSEVVVRAKSGDEEKATLEPFGSKGGGDFIASVRTTSDPSEKNDGVLTVQGAEELEVVYVDRNTETGEVNKKLLATAQVVSTGAIAFMDGAMRQRVRGVFAGQPTNIRVRDLDMDVTPKPDKVQVVVKVQYRERPERAADADPNAPPPAPAPDAPWLTRNEITLDLEETADRSGVFVGRVTPKLCEGDKISGEAGPGEVLVLAGDRLVAEYVDKLDLSDAKKPQVRTGEALVLVGGTTEPQSIVSHANDATVQAKKLLLEAQLLCKWGGIFKEVGLEANAAAKAEEGLARVEDIFSLMKRFSLERDVIEHAYEARWNLLLVKGKLDQAIQVCRALVKAYPDTLLADRAFMQIADANRLKDTEASRGTAIQVYKSILTLPDSPLKAEAQFRIGEILEHIARLSARPDTKPNFSSAMAAFKRCADTYPNSSYAGESIKRVIDYYISIRDYNRAQETLERVFQDYPDAPWLDEMLLKWGVVCHRLGQREGALEKFRRLLEEYPGGASAKSAAEFIRKLEQ